MNKLQIQSIISIPVTIGLIFSTGFFGFQLVQGDATIVSTFMNFYNRQPVEVFPSFVTPVLMFTGFLMLVSAVLLTGALFKREFCLNKEANLLKWGVFSAIFSFTLYGFAVRMISNHQAAANLFFYVGILYFFLWFIEKETREFQKNTFFNQVKLLPIFLMMLYTMGQPGFQKLFNTSKVMGNYTAMFQDSFLAQMPGGIPPFIYLLGILEFAVPILILVSLAKREFLSSQPKPFFNWAMFVSVTTFIMLAFGLAVLLNFPGSTNLIFYAVISLGFYVYAKSSQTIQ